MKQSKEMMINDLCLNIKQKPDERGRRKPTTNIELLVSDKGQTYGSLIKIRCTHHVQFLLESIITTFDQVWVRYLKLQNYKLNSEIAATMFEFDYSREPTFVQFISKGHLILFHYHQSRELYTNDLTLLSNFVCQ